MQLQKGDVPCRGMSEPMVWWNGTIGQVSEVLGVYEPTGFIHVRLHMPTYWVDVIDSHYQLNGWLVEKFVEVVHSRRRSMS